MPDVPPQPCVVDDGLGRLVPIPCPSPPPPCLTTQTGGDARVPPPPCTPTPVPALSAWAMWTLASLVMVLVASRLRRV